VGRDRRVASLPLHCHSGLDAFRNNDGEVCPREAPNNSCSCDVFVLARILLDVLLTRSRSIKIVFVKRDRDRKKRPRALRNVHGTGEP
jgi:hypothetical protein